MRRARQMGGESATDLKDIVDTMIYKFTTIEMAHEMHAPTSSNRTASGKGNIAAFLQRFDPLKRRIMPLMQYWSSTDTTKLAENLTALLTAEEEVVTRVSRAYDVYMHMLASVKPCIERIAGAKATIDATRQQFKGGKILIEPGQPYDGQYSFITVEQAYSMIKQTQDKFQELLPSLKMILRMPWSMNDAQNDPPHLVHKMKAADVGMDMTWNSMTEKLNAAQRDLEVLLRLNDFESFVREFAPDSKNDMRSKYADAVFQDLDVTLETLENMAALDSLYTAPMVQAIQDMIHQGVADIERKFVQERKTDTKKVTGLLSELKAALDMVNPVNHESPNFALRRGSRFMWTDAKVKLKAVANFYAELSSDQVLDESIERQGFLFRRPNLERMAYYRDMVREFRDGLDTSLSGDDGSVSVGKRGFLVEALNTQFKSLIKRVEASAKDINDQIHKLPKEDPAYAAFQTTQLAVQKYAVLNHMFVEARSVMRKYLQLHLDFALKTNRQALRYMAYWRAIDLASPEANSFIEEYVKLLGDPGSSVTFLGTKQLDEWIDLVEVLFNRDEIIAYLEADEAQRLGDKLVDLTEWKQQKAVTLIQRVHGGPPSIFDILGDLQFLIVYVLKLVRYFFLVIALVLARRIFQGIYNDKVYGKNAAPPHPAIMIGIFLGIDIALQVGLISTLAFTKYMFYHGAGTFPIDGPLLTRLILDYCVGYVVIAVIALIMSDIVRKRKYFRYRYEGERGIKALELMVRYSSAVIVALPFFRMAD